MPSLSGEPDTTVRVMEPQALALFTSQGAWVPSLDHQVDTDNSTATGLRA